MPQHRLEVSLVHADRKTPGFMRSPPEVPYLFALESAMDELAVALDVDPLELRRRNDTEREPIKGLPYTSRSRMACFDAAAAAFGCFRLQRIVGWALHPLESAALSRRTPEAVPLRVTEKRLGSSRSKSA
jgi:CO/xanthine dehydrogenase Mo-binding subunit